MYSSHKVAIARLRAAKVDGRTENVRFRQMQLQYLHRELVALSDELRGAIRKDASFSEAEADVEFAAGMTCVKDAYESLNFDQSLEDEYSTARGLDYPERRAGFGLVYIRPGKAFSFYSVLSPLAAAIAAGNCILLQLDENLRYLPDLLRGAFKKSLDPDVFAVIEGDFNDQSFLAEAIRVDQDSADTNLPAVSELRSRSTARAIAVVDRTADIEAAAETIVKARLAFNGTSAYAPDLVVVNEFAKKRFLDAAAKHIVAFSTTSANGKKADQRVEKTVLQKAQDDSSSTVVTSGSSGSLVEISRNSPLLQQKIAEPVLLVTDMTSLEDAIDFVNTNHSQTSGLQTTHLASYVFATPKTAKYLSQFIRSDASFVNTIPSALLVGPAAPYYPHQPLSVSSRYTPEMFSACSPQIVHASASSVDISQALFGGVSKKGVSAKQLADLATKPLKPTGQPLQHARIGFFEQGILIGLGTAATPILLGLGTGVFFGVRFLWQRFH